MSKKPKPAVLIPVSPARHYWDAFSLIKRNQIYLDLAAQRYETYERYLNVFTAIASSGAIGGWIIWQQYAGIWGAVVAASHVITAIRPYLPFAQRLKALHPLCAEMASIAINAESDWIKISRAMLTEEEILALTKSMKHAVNQKDREHFKGMSMPENKKLLSRANAICDAHMSTFSEG